MSEPTRKELEDFFDKRFLAKCMRAADVLEQGFENCATCNESGLVNGAICPDCNGYGLTIPYGNGEPQEGGQCT